MLEVSFLGNSLQNYLIFFLYLALGFALGKVLFGISKTVVHAFTRKTKTHLDDMLLERLEKPAIFMVALGCFYIGVNFLILPFGVQRIVDGITLVLFVLNLCWIVINVIDAVILYYVTPYAEKSRSDLDDALVPIIRKLIKVVLWIVVIVMILKNFGYDVSALLTGVGLGGLAFALAAQDLLSNLFGGVAILTDKPFKIGQRIKIGQTDGFVREIGLRTTRIETLAGTQVVVPNSEIAKTTLENVSREKARRITARIGLEYSTSKAKIVECENIIKDIIKKNNDTDDKCLVGFSEFGDSALIMDIIYWIKDIDNMFKVRNDVNLEIRDRLEKARISMAFPTRTVHVINSPFRR